MTEIIWMHVHSIHMFRMKLNLFSWWLQATCVLGMLLNWFESMCICFLKQPRRVKRPRTAKTETCNSLMHIFELTVTVLHSHKQSWILGSNGLGEGAFGFRRCSVMFLSTSYSSGFVIGHLFDNHWVHWLGFLGILSCWVCEFVWVFGFCGLYSCAESPLPKETSTPGAGSALTRAEARSARSGCVHTLLRMHVVDFWCTLMIADACWCTSCMWCLKFAFWLLPANLEGPWNSGVAVFSWGFWHSVALKILISWLKGRNLIQDI